MFEDLARRFEAPSARNRWDMPLFVARPGAASGGEQGGGIRCGPGASGSSEGVTSGAGGALGLPAREEGGWEAVSGGPGCDAGRAGVPATLKPEAGVPVDAAQGAAASGAGALQDRPPTAEGPCPSGGAADSREAAGAGGRTLDPNSERPGAEPVPRGAGCIESGRSAAGGTAAGRDGSAMDGRGSSHAPMAIGTAALECSGRQVRDDHMARSCSVAHVSSGTATGRGASAEHPSPGTPDPEHPNPDTVADGGGPAAAAPGVAAPHAGACDSGLDRVLQARAPSCQLVPPPHLCLSCRQLCWAVCSLGLIYTHWQCSCAESRPMTSLLFPSKNKQSWRKANVCMAARSTHPQAGGSGFKKG